MWSISGGWHILSWRTALHGCPIVWLRKSWIVPLDVIIQLLRSVSGWWNWLERTRIIPGIVHSTRQEWNFPCTSLDMCSENRSVWTYCHFAEWVEMTISVSVEMNKAPPFLISENGGAYVMLRRYPSWIFQRRFGRRFRGKTSLKGVAEHSWATIMANNAAQGCSEHSWGSIMA